MKELEYWRTEDEFGVVMPWYTRPCLEWLNTLDLKGKDVFEFGCGVSTLWYRSREANVKGVDSNEEWLMGQTFAIEKEDYLNAIKGMYDLIVIDGIHRDDCAKVALKHLRTGGYLIADNWDQPSGHSEWDKTKDVTKDLPITVYKQDGHPDWKTAVWKNIII